MQSSEIGDGIELSLDNRDYLMRAVRHLAELGVDQFLDLGSRLPSRPREWLNPTSRTRDSHTSTTTRRPSSTAGRCQWTKTPGSSTPT